MPWPWEIFLGFFDRDVHCGAVDSLDDGAFLSVETAVNISFLQTVLDIRCSDKYMDLWRVSGYYLHTFMYLHQGVRLLTLHLRWNIQNHRFVGNTGYHQFYVQFYVHRLAQCVMFNHFSSV
jgi:hypothetical protein